jgi:hypothetical protein
MRNAEWGAQGRGVARRGIPAPAERPFLTKRNRSAHHSAFIIQHLLFVIQHLLFVIPHFPWSN